MFDPILGDPTTGKDSVIKMLRRNLSPTKIKSLKERVSTSFEEEGKEATFKKLKVRMDLMVGITPKEEKVFSPHADIPTYKELKNQREVVFEKQPLFSVVVPIYNTPLPYLEELIQSILKQSYVNWELILVDASTEEYKKVGKLAKKHSRKDERIRYIPIEDNEGIAENTNKGIEQAAGDYFILLDHDDVLQLNALYEVTKAINEQDADFVYSDELVLNDDLSEIKQFHYKPDFGADTLRGCNYITHLCAFSKTLLEKIGGKEDLGYDGAQDYDLILRLTEQANSIVHIPKMLYWWRSHEDSTANDIYQKPYAVVAGADALDAHLERIGMEGKVDIQKDALGSYRIKYAVKGNPKISVLIPNKDHVEELKCCIESIDKYGGWDNIEVIIIDNNSTETETETYYLEVQEKYNYVRVIRYTGNFNFSAICNYGAKESDGEQIVLLNNDVELLTSDFFVEMLSYSQRSDVGAVGARLYYPDDTIQHAGLFIGIGGTAGVSHKGNPRETGGHLFRVCTVQNMSAVTGACLMVKRELYDELGGLDEDNFAVAFNDVDFCLRLVEKGYTNIYTPFAEAYHYESKSRGLDETGPNKIRFDKEAANFKRIHADILEKGDPYYNPHLTLSSEGYSLKEDYEVKHS